MLASPMCVSGGPLSLILQICRVYGSGKLLRMALEIFQQRWVGSSECTRAFTNFCTVEFHVCLKSCVNVMIICSLTQSRGYTDHMVTLLKFA